MIDEFDNPVNRLTLTIDLGNEAFTDNAGPELARLLRESADRLQGWTPDRYGLSVSGGTLLDVNGNGVGGWTVKYEREDEDAHDGEDDDVGHEDGDGCAIYFTEYRVHKRPGEDDNPIADWNDPRTSVEDLEPGDEYADPAFEPEGSWLTVSDVAVIDGQVHIESEDAGDDD